MTPDRLVPPIAGTAVAIALLAGALVAYARWRRAGDALALLTSAFAAGLGGLARYDLFVVGGALSALTLVAPRVHPAGKHDERPAFAIAYAAAVAGVLGLWLLVAVLTTGDPFAFAGRTLLEDAASTYPVRPEIAR